MAAALTRDEFLARVAAKKASLPRDTHILPGIGAVTIRGLSGKERDAVTQLATIKSGKRKGETDSKTFRDETLALCVINDDGTPFFQPGDLQALLDLQPDYTDGLYLAVNVLSGIGKQEVEALGNDSASPVVSADSASSSL